MNQVSGQPGTDGAFELGHQALAEGRWEDAAELFDRAIAAKETPEAHEGRCWAAWWQSDIPQVFSSRERAFALYRERGDRTSAARVAAWMAWDTVVIRGEPAIADGWLRRGHRLVEGLAPGTDHGWLWAHEAGIALLESDTRRALDSAAAAASLGHDAGNSDLEMVGRAIEGAAMVREGQMKAGMARLDEASAIALTGESRLLITVGWTCCYVISSYESVLDYERATQWCDRGREWAERNRVPFLLARCRGYLAEALLWRGEWQQAEAELTGAIEALSGVRPGGAAESLVRLAELRRRQGRRQDATVLLDRVERHPLALLGRGRLALDAGNAKRALEFAERHLRRAPSGNVALRAPGEELAATAALALGELEQAERRVEALREAASALGTDAFLALAKRIEGELLTARGELQDARHLLEDAVDLLAGNQAAYELAQARISLAECLRAAGDSTESVREARLARDELLELGAGDPLRARAAALAEAPEARRPGTVPGLSPRECEVLDLVAAGLTNREIAERLVISPHTVHRHLSNTLRKLGVGSRAAAVARAAELRARDMA